MLFPYQIKLSQSSSFSSLRQSFRFSPFRFTPKIFRLYTAMLCFGVSLPGCGGGRVLFALGRFLCEDLPRLPRLCPCEYVSVILPFKISRQLFSRHLSRRRRLRRFCKPRPHLVLMASMPFKSKVAILIQSCSSISDLFAARQNPP